MVLIHDVALIQLGDCLQGNAKPSVWTGLLASGCAHGDGAYLGFAIDRVRANLAALDTNPLAPLDAMSGAQVTRNASEFG